MTHHLQIAIHKHLKEHALTSQYNVIDNVNAAMPFIRFSGSFGVDVGNYSLQMNNEKWTLDFYTDNEIGSLPILQMMGNVQRAMRAFTFDNDFIHVSAPNVDLMQTQVEEITDEKRTVYHGILQFSFFVQYKETTIQEPQYI